MNVLIFPCGSEIGLEIHRSLKNKKDINLIGATSVKDDPGIVEYSVVEYITPLKKLGNASFYKELNFIIEKHKIDILIPANDFVLLELKVNETDINCQVLSHPLETVLTCNSKSMTYDNLKDEVRAPRVFTSIDKVKYPCFCKPDEGHSSIGCFVVNDPIVATTILNSDNQLLLEYLPGDEFTVDCFTDFNGNLKFASARTRGKITKGISCYSEILEPSKQHEFKEMAEKINNNLKFNGAWFFQVKRNAYHEITLMEIGCRIAGSSGIQRANNVNFTELGLLNFRNIPVEIMELVNLEIELYRGLYTKMVIKNSFSKVYVDYDDTLVIDGKINSDLLGLLQSLKNDGKYMILITRHRGDLLSSLGQFSLRHFFNEIIWLTTENELKSESMSKDSIFIDDSFKERMDAISKGIPSFSPETIKDIVWK